MVVSNKTDMILGTVNIPHEGLESYDNIYQKVGPICVLERGECLLVSTTPLLIRHCVAVIINAAHHPLQQLRYAQFGPTFTTTTTTCTTTFTLVVTIFISLWKT